MDASTDSGGKAADSPALPYLFNKPLFLLPTVKRYVLIILQTRGAVCIMLGSRIDDGPC